MRWLKKLTLSCPIPLPLLGMAASVEGSATMICMNWLIVLYCIVCRSASEVFRAFIYAICVVVVDSEVCLVLAPEGQNSYISDSCAAKIYIHEFCLRQWHTPFNGCAMWAPSNRGLLIDTIAGPQEFIVPNRPPFVMKSLSQLRLIYKRASGKLTKVPRGSQTKVP